MTALLAATNLSAGYRRGNKQTAVLQGITLRVERGEMVCLLGPNGTGKSTLMRTLARALPPLSGAIEVSGQDIARMNPAERARHIGIVLTERVAIGAMPAFRLVELGRYPHVNWMGHLSAADHAIVSDAIHAVGATHLAQRDVNELSDGERQRFMIARALAQRPSVLLLDEPGAYLDVSARVEMMAMLRRLARDEGMAVILSSHDLDLSLRTADTIWLIERTGSFHAGAPEDLLADGRVAEAFSTPEIVFSAAERGFKIVGKARALAFIEGTESFADLARTVLEREGYAVTENARAADLTVAAETGGWSAYGGEKSGRGASFAELARFARKILHQEAGFEA